MMEYLRNGAARLRAASKQIATSVDSRARQVRNRALYKADQFWVMATHWELRHRRAVLLALVGAAVAGSALYVSSVKQDLWVYFADQGRLGAAQTLLVTLGGALVGAAAIAFSVLIFSMQVNIERMPHAVFRRVSSDPVLMSQLAAMIILSIAIASSSIVIDPDVAGLPPSNPPD